jgi:23S rRNA G2445 N2-methylase RlmL
MKFLLHTQIGIEKITELELEQKFKGEYSLDYSGYVPHKNGIVQIEWKNEKNLKFYEELKTIEDAYFILDYVSDINQDFDLKRIYKMLDKDKVNKNVDYFFDKLNDFGPANEFRFVTRKKAANDFRRIDLQSSIKDFFKKNNRRIEGTHKEGVKEIWSTLVKNRLIVTVRLTTKEKRQSYYKSAMVTGTLRPSVAYAMAMVAEINSKNSLWDPFCGAGTIGAEVTENFKFGKLILADRSPEAITATKENLSNLKSFKTNKGKISVREEDFFASKNYSDIVISNLPFGNKYEINERFIQDFMVKVDETKQITKLVLLFPDLISDTDWFYRRNFNEKWQLTRKFPVQVLGFPAFIQVLKKAKN